MKKKFRISGYYLMVIPVMVVVALFFIYPIAQVVRMSFYKSSPIYGEKWLGLKAYIKILSDSVFWESLIRNLEYVGVVVTANFFLGISFALLTYKAGRGVRILRTVYILPMLFMPSAAAITWALLYDEGFGLINHFLKLIGFVPQMWLARGSTGIFAVMITDIWGWVPFMYLILLAGLQSLPMEPAEAALMDGAGAWQRFWYITLPMMKPAIAVAIILKTMGVFRAFDFVWIMTRGGPGDGTQVLSTLIFSRAFILFEYGKGSTMAVIMVLFGFALAFGLMMVFKEKVRSTI